jgi:hypothetical protein
MTVTRRPDQGRWRIGGSSEVAWINRATRAGLAITAAIPPRFARYATIVIPEADADKDRSDAAIVRLLATHSPAQPWWLGYLNAGGADIILPEAATVSVYTNWPYVLLEAGPQQALTLRSNAQAMLHHSALPELLFPADRSWLVSTLWDDDWRCVGGPATLVNALLQHPLLDARAVTLRDDATPPGHEAI